MDLAFFTAEIITQHSIYSFNEINTEITRTVTYIYIYGAYKTI